MFLSNCYSCTINGTSFDGTANITTANWGTARNISITDGTNTSTAVSVNGSRAYSLNLPSTIKATFVGNITGNVTGNCSGSSGSCTGNAATATTATKATQDSAGQQIDTTYIKGLAVSGRTITYTKGDGTTGTITTQDTNTDTKVTQTVTTTNAEYPVLFSADANKTATSTTTAGFSSNIKINPSTNTITATTFKGNCSGSSGSCTGNAVTATQFSANATVALTGDATGTSAGSKKGWSVPVTLANSGVTAGTYGPSADVTGNNNATISVPEITVDAKGRVTSVVNRTLTCKNDTYKVYNKTLTIQKNGTNVATFTSNSNTDVAANITVPTKVSELTNDSGFLTSHQSLSNYVTLNGAQTISGAKTFTGNIIGINKERSTEDANSLYSTTAGSKLTYYTTSNGGTTLTNVPAAVNTTLESRTIRRLSDSDWIVEQICHNSNGLYYRKGSNGTWGAWKTFAFTDSNISGNAATATTATTAEACTGNAASATKLQTARTINGTSFNGTANITTANWGTARDITIADSTGDNTGEAVSVNGSAAVTLKLPATIKASLDGNAATATSATTAASATTATNATNAAKLGNIASSGYVQTGKVNQTIDGTKTFSAAIASSIKTNTYIDGNKGVAIINSTAPAGYNMLYRIKSTNGVFTGGVFNQNYELHYTVDTTIAANTNAVTYTTTLMNEAGDATFAKNVTIGVGLTVKGDANFANITTSYITGLFTE